jgi:uncharacterized PurR-regulated membrane protein YhhQ (DUF165 family)
MVPVGFGLVATAGTYFAGLAFVLRDSVQDAGGRRLVLTLIIAGALLSYLVSDPFIALASGVAFLVSETVDMGIYTPLRKRGYFGPDVNLPKLLAWTRLNGQPGLWETA